MSKDHKHDYSTDDPLDAAERFWIGPKDRTKHTIYKMQWSSTERAWLEAADGTQLDPNYSDFSVRIHDPKARSLSFIYRTICIIPKSRLRTIYNLIGEYLNEIDSR